MVNKPVVVDAHQHFWERPDHDFLQAPDMAPLRRPFGPGDLRPLLAAAGVDATVLVQTRSSLAETREFLALAAATDFIAGVVGWVDLTSPRVAEVIAGLQARPDGDYLVGIRHQVHDEADAGWLLRPEVQNGLRAVQDAGLVYDLLIRPRELPAAVETARAFPGLRFVIDHLAKPPIASHDVDAWAEAMAPFRRMPHVACKLSGMVTEAAWSDWRPADLVPYVDRVVDWFGSDRLMFGSDWPICLLAGTYKQVVEACRQALGDIPETTRQKIFGGNAIRIYGLTISTRDDA